MPMGVQLGTSGVINLIDAENYRFHTNFCNVQLFLQVIFPISLGVLEFEIKSMRSVTIRTHLKNLENYGFNIDIVSLFYFYM